MHWWANVMLRDLETGNQLWECWIEKVDNPEATTKAEAARQLVNKAWDNVDSRLNDVTIELVDGPTRYA
mgnify:FL=1